MYAAACGWDMEAAACGVLVLGFSSWYSWYQLMYLVPVPVDVSGPGGVRGLQGDLSLWNQVVAA